MHNFYALLCRMNHINRWSLMRSTQKESLMEHTAQVAILAQALALIRNTYFGGNLNVDRVATLALYHDTPEVVTGDLPTPIKYYNGQMKDAYKEIEGIVISRLLSILPQDLQPNYASFLQPDSATEEYAIVKCADKLSAHIKCIEERASGNHEYDVAYETTLADLKKMPQPEVAYFLDNFLDGFGKPLDLL